MSSRKRVNIDLSFSQANMDKPKHSMSVNLVLYDRWKGGRKQQPEYHLELSPSQAQQLAVQIAREMNRVAMAVETCINTAKDSFDGE